MNLWAEIKDYFKQIKIEIKRMFKSKGMIVFMAILLLFCIGFPVLAYRNENKEVDLSKYIIKEDVYDGVTVAYDNPLHYNVRVLDEALADLNKNASGEPDYLAQEWNEIFYDFYLEMSQIMKNNGDYREKLVYATNYAMQDILIIEYMDDITVEEMALVLDKIPVIVHKESYLESNFYSLTKEELDVKYNDAEEKIAHLKHIIVNDDFVAYIDYEIENKNKTIELNKERIEEFQQQIVKEPDKEDTLNENIRLSNEIIDKIKEIDIPILKYRKENRISENSDDWRNLALYEKEHKMYHLYSAKDIKTEDEFYANKGFSSNYASYREYEIEYYEILNYSTEILLAADKSLETNKPDMRYAEDGSRKRIDNFLDFNIFVVFFAIIIGGGILAKDFKSGTIRLLLIRPKRRVKIALSRLFALLIITLIFYFACVVANAVVNGALFGMKDLLFPNYTIKHPDGILFFTYILPRVLICFVPVIFFGCMAYCLSSVTKNTALSVSVPFIFYIAALIVVEVLGYDEINKWLSYTPFPYINMTSILWDNYYIGATIGKGMLVLSIGIVLFIIIGNLSFAKRDVTN